MDFGKKLSTLFPNRSLSPTVASHGLIDRAAQTGIIFVLRNEIP